MEENLMAAPWLLATLFWFLISSAVCLLKRNNGLVDIFWGFGFVVLSGVSFFTRSEHSVSSILITLIVWIWGLRLSFYLFFRNWDKPEDFRYANWRNAWGKRWILYSILKVYLLQGLIMQWIAIPIFLVNVVGLNAAKPKNTWMFLGAAIAGLGIMIEAIADFQKSLFKKKAKNQQEICRIGLWKISRHPNYLGEILTWLGIGIIPLSLHWGWLALLSPALIIFLLYKVSGVPMLEERMKGREDFDEYRRSTGAIFPVLKAKTHR